MPGGMACSATRSAQRGRVWFLPRCASCGDEWTGDERIDADSVPEDVHPVSIESVGRYAIQIHWSDDHSTGIYPFERLRELGTPAAPAKPGD